MTEPEEPEVSTDPFLDPVAEFQSVVGQDGDEIAELPDSVKELIERVRGGDSPAGSAVTVVVGPDGPKLIGADDIPANIQAMMLESLETLLTKDGRPSYDPDSVMGAVMAQMEAMPEGASAESILTGLGWSEIDIAEAMDRVKATVIAGFRRNFIEEAYDRLFTETDVVEHIIICAQYDFTTGVMVEQERRRRADESVSTDGGAE